MAINETQPIERVSVATERKDETAAVPFAEGVEQVELSEPLKAERDAGDRSARGYRDGSPGPVACLPAWFPVRRVR